MERELMLLEKIIDEAREYSFYEILEKSEFSREPTYRHLQRLVERGFIRKKRIGNIYLYSLNLENEFLHPILSFIHMKKLGPELREKAEKLKPALPKNTLFAYFDGDAVVVGYSGKPELDEIFKKAGEMGLEARGVEIRNFRRHVARKGLRMLSGIRVFYNGERLFREIADALASE